VTNYTIRHVTRFTYETVVTESIMEVRMQPRSEGGQRCLRFELSSSPRARVLGYRDPQGNLVHHFDIPARHNQLTLTARAEVQIAGGAPLPEGIPVSAWQAIDAWDTSGQHWDFLQPSRFAVWSDALRAFVEPIGDGRETDPLTSVRRVMYRIHEVFEYVPKSTRVDSPIDEALSTGRGVCQDFTHVMIAAVRLLGVPCRYVSGYLSPRRDDERERLEAVATHAWVEALLPELGWVGFDPTNGVDAQDRHIRVAVGRDYADVPPTRGVFKGGARSELSVAVEVTSVETPVAPLLPPEPQWVAQELEAPTVDADFERELEIQQQQQQQ
jgi:transglutaminase-like putative cysteine protease